MKQTGKLLFVLILLSGSLVHFAQAGDSIQTALLKIDGIT